ncbi:Nucleophosmin 1 / RNA binding protein-like protein [Leishmania donovani]|uniref:RNA_binding_protein-like_protein/GeneDB:LmjF.07.1 000 n=1 Tax=Leishmania donovani TaxID=5661 RepID=A0A6J8F647_LEIDO|nr:Nucleophosmin 1 / RNA binding protein-like protein [Leishmania donovani]VDZ42244.1 RNA_binding_protein-like_protein/GeneDB:LmjF.07.1000 [Leishmania donovani]
MMQEFHAFSVSPNKEHKLEIPAGCGFHLSVVSLPRGTNGKSTVYVSADGKSYALASLDSQQNVLQAPTDLIFNYQQQVIFFAKGSATVHCVGYRQELDFSDDDDAPFAMESGSDDDTRDAKKAAVKLPADAITDAETAKRKPAAAAAATESVSEDEEDEDEDEELADSAEEASADAASDEGSDGEEIEEDEDEEEENDEEYDDDDEIDSDIAKEPRGMQARHVDPTAPSSEDEEDGTDGNDDEESDEEMDSDDLAAMEEDEEDVDDDDKEEAEPPMKVIRAEGRPSGGSLQSRPSAGGSPQGLKKNGSGSSQGRPNGHSPQGRPSAGGSPQGLKKNGSGSSQGRPNGHSPQGRRGL